MLFNGKSFYSSFVIRKSNFELETRAPEFTPDFLMGSVLSIFLIFCVCCVFCFCLSSFRVLCAQCCQCLLIGNSVFSNLYLFVEYMYFIICLMMLKKHSFQQYLVLLMEETGGPGKNHRHVAICLTNFIT